LPRSVLVVASNRSHRARCWRRSSCSGRVFQQHNTRFALPECPQIHYPPTGSLSDGSRYIPGEGWHTDHSNERATAKATACTPSPADRGGDTQYANMAPLVGAVAGPAGADRGSGGHPCLPKQPQRAKADGAVGRQQGARAQRGSPSLVRTPIRRTPPVDLHQPDPIEGTSAWTTRRPCRCSTSAAARHGRKVPVSPIAGSRATS